MRVHFRERDETLLREVAEAIGEQGLQLEVLSRDSRQPDERVDARVRIRHPEGQLDLEAEIELQLTPGTFGPTAGHLRGHGRSGVLITDYVSPNLAERLREQGLFFLDAAGNAFLRDRGLYVWVTGRRNRPEIQRVKERGRAFQPSGLKLLFALLCKPELVEADYRTLASATGTALGTVHLVLHDLIEERHVRRIDRTRRVLLRPKELLDAWVQAFVRELRPRLLLGRFAAADLDWWQRTDILPYGSLWGGEPAGARLTGFLKPGTLTLYAEQVPADLLVHQRLKRDAQGKIEILQRFWKFTDTNEGAGLVPPILAYADLLAIGDDRTLETAERLFEQHINGSFQAYLARTGG
jgi:hypothetical protein